MTTKQLAMALVPILLAAMAGTASADYVFSTGDPDGKIATASRPDSAGKIEIESADDFLLTSHTMLTSAAFTGLLPSTLPLTDIQDVRVEIYRVFPKDSTDPPSGNVPTRTNSPSDVAFDSRSTSVGDLTFTTTLLSQNFTAANSVLNGIHPLPNPLTGGEGPVSGQEVRFNVAFTTPLDLLADHYFFIPQVQLTSGDFYWLSAARPIGPGGTPFAPDFQSWIRNADLDPDWLRIGTDIVGGTTFNASFSLNGRVVPEPGSLALIGLGGLIVGGTAWRRRARARA